MKKAYTKGEVLENRELSERVYLMKVDLDMEAAPGQFVMVRGEDFRQDPFLSRPLGIVDLDGGALSLLYQEVGRGTSLLSKEKPGNIVEVLGPLGNGFEIETGKKTAVLAGGIGLAPLYFLVKNLEEKPDFYAGFADDPYFIDPFKPYCQEIILTSDVKDKKFITEAIDPDAYDIIYACGPNPMLKALAQKNKTAKIQVSLEAHMACGIGACLGCTVETSKGLKRVCKDGPVFDSREVFG